MSTIRKRNPGERKTLKNGKPIIVFRGRLGALVNFPMLVANNNDEFEERMFEQFVRPPGTRMLVVQSGKILLQKEYRLENDLEDWRLPGGKVMDGFKEYELYLEKDMPEAMVLEAGKRELREEARLEAKHVSLIKKSICGASVAWDLYYLLVTEFEKIQFDHHIETEEIIGHEWKTFDEVRELCKNGSISEDRTVAVLYKYIESVK